MPFEGILEPGIYLKPPGYYMWTITSESLTLWNRAAPACRLIWLSACTPCFRPFPCLAACVLVLEQTWLPCAIVLSGAPATLPGSALVLSLLNWFVLSDLAQPNYFLWTHHSLLCDAVALTDHSVLVLTSVCNVYSFTCLFKKKLLSTKICPSYSCKLESPWCLFLEWWSGVHPPTRGWVSSLRAGTLWWLSGVLSN